ncbi:helix-turn-helix transcriptional regulator [Haloarchaeobius amylolyticus]|uniref:helix-turn-helix transcriptional regulator n=1 Tax=Haloarchaeobius amylolyticus TaxID=1198296 RepID=UPI00226E60C6|nr:hypothetical protein [Haloarchaeobius amylolyticus]
MDRKLSKLRDSLDRVLTGFNETADPPDASPEQPAQPLEEPAGTSGVRHQEFFDRFEPETLETPNDVTQELGLLPEQFVTELLRAHGGKMRQQAFYEHTAWSSSSLSRLLKRMEREDSVVRIRAGREKVVYLPGTVPDHVE